MIFLFDVTIGHSQDLFGSPNRMRSRPGMSLSLLTRGKKAKKTCEINLWSTPARMSLGFEIGSL